VTNHLKLTAEQFDDLRAHLLRNHDEQVAFAFAAIAEANDNRVFEVADLFLVPQEDFVIQTEYHVELTEDVLSRVIKMAWDRKAAIVDFHSHPRASTPVSFSPSDLFGFADLVPHANWRLRGKPYLGVVLAPNSFDALVWSGGYGSPEELTGILVVGQDPVSPTGISYSRFDRE
jgi:hypothetical protein